MTSSDQITGRTWFDGAESMAEDVALNAYMGIRVDTSLMRSNAITFTDFRDEHNADSMRVLLRTFLRIQHVLINGKIGQGATALLEWDAPTVMDRPHAVYVHVLYNPPAPDADIVDEAQKVLINMMETDSKLYRQARPGKHIQASNMVVSIDMWAAMCKFSVS